MRNLWDRLRRFCRPPVPLAVLRPSWDMTAAELRERAERVAERRRQRRRCAALVVGLGAIVLALAVFVVFVVF